MSQLPGMQLIIEYCMYRDIFHRINQNVSVYVFVFLTNQLIKRKFMSKILYCGFEARIILGGNDN